MRIVAGQFRFMHQRRSRSPVRCTGASIPGAQAPGFAVAARCSRRCSSRRRTMSSLPASTSQSRPVNGRFSRVHKWPVLGVARGEGDVASPHEGSVVLGPVPDAIRCLVLRMHSRLHIEIMTRLRSRWSTCRPLLAHRAESAHQRRDSPAPEAGSTPSATASPRDRLAVLATDAPVPAPQPAVASRTALQFSVQDILDGRVLQRQVRVHPLELGVFSLELPQLSHIRHRRAPVLAPPLEECRLADAVRP